MTPIRPCACVHDSLGAGRRPILFSGLDKFWIKGQARRVVDWGRKDAACGMAEEDGVKMSGLRLDRPAAPRLGCARGVTGVTGRTDEQTTRCRIISFHSAGEAFVRRSAQRGDGRTVAVVFPLPFFFWGAARHACDFVE